MGVNLIWPEIAKGRGPGFWSRVGNLKASRRKLRSDRSNEWRYESSREALLPQPPRGNDPDPAARSRSVPWLLDRPGAAPVPFRCLILGDTGEGDYSQFGALPVIRALRPDFIVINGDVAYPAGSSTDFDDGFFDPYAGLNLPIWAVPGNHEYYSKQRGREFLEVFCSEVRRAEWDKASLRLKPQPGTYWELKSSESPAAGLVLLGVDTGHSADLDGSRAARRWRLLPSQPPDDRQHEWLDWRLRSAQRQGTPVILLFHIPALVREAHDSETKLTTLHRLIATYPAVRAVITAHEHNFQAYTPATFGRYLETQFSAKAAMPPDYMVAGASGAYLSSTDFTDGAHTGFSTSLRYPDAEDWKEWAGIGLRIAASQKTGRGFFNNLASMVVSAVKPGIAEESDVDRPARLSLLVVDHDPGKAAGRRTTIQPCFIDDLTEMYGHLPSGTPIHVQAGSPPVDPSALAHCLRASPIVF